MSIALFVPVLGGCPTSVETTSGEGEGFPATLPETSDAAAPALHVEVYVAPTESSPIRYLGKDNHGAMLASFAPSPDAEQWHPAAVYVSPAGRHLTVWTWSDGLPTAAVHEGRALEFPNYRSGLVDVVLRLPGTLELSLRLRKWAQKIRHDWSGWYPLNGLRSGCPRAGFRPSMRGLAMNRAGFTWQMDAYVFGP